MTAHAKAPNHRLYVVVKEHKAEARLQVRARPGATTLIRAVGDLGVSVLPGPKLTFPNRRELDILDPMGCPAEGTLLDPAGKGAERKGAWRAAGTSSEVLQRISGGVSRRGKMEPLKKLRRLAKPADGCFSFKTGTIAWDSTGARCRSRSIGRGHGYSLTWATLMLLSSKMRSERDTWRDSEFWTVPRHTSRLQTIYPQAKALLSKASRHQR
ncbi:hypothetical protein CYMTET_47967 [Cymbomonas tetramitiformis]|uniref:Uncharacterized protein n=1 Tax=Cymbomonas tetramitiformis TaxID=36881 RepID=A0AAE0EVG5_9CHLO|nr:hypothetical protein CYMTET_47967 [Cymbomonas tetramitiformis]